MPYTTEEKRERRKEYYKKNREKELKRAIEYNNKHKQKLQKIRKERDKNRKEEIKEYNQAYRRTPQGKKRQRISEWKSQGMIADDFDAWYVKYINCNECNFCHKEFTSTKNRHLDHNHDINDCENIRGILCKDCNVKDVFLDLLI